MHEQIMQIYILLCSVDSNYNLLLLHFYFNILNSWRAFIATFTWDLSTCSTTFNNTEVTYTYFKAKVQ